MYKLSTQTVVPHMPSRSSVVFWCNCYSVKNLLSEGEKFYNSPTESICHQTV